ncbi:restriction endonuclease [Arthrobacter sp. MYb211]|uniref:PmeII family type II restriction endonuclease n=1 Tax=unclassified Arthrobacter TaxID=235627 RepID=UPI000CFABF93|nr:MULTISPECIES: PmeII family type II restriction endonuclease [unclassified Arthrobacter]PRA12135.1 restriction endonuclease [Arthrobacter sp. MYb221]PRC08598.1 restriction endonuclease [Arthrobacter sp. MYb211]
MNSIINIDTANERRIILEKLDTWFDEHIAKNHVINTNKLVKISEFNINHFTLHYLAEFSFGEITPQSIAKTLLYPRVMGTSIATSFGQHFQTFCHEVLKATPSIVPGIDIEFVDQVDGRHKWCQLKAGPTTLNKDDVPVIKDKFISIKHLARTNKYNINVMSDCIVGVAYGNPLDLNNFYAEIAKDFPVIVGQDLWLRITGDDEFYAAILDKFRKIASKYRSASSLQSTVNQLSEYLRENPAEVGLNSGWPHS